MKVFEIGMFLTVGIFAAGCASKKLAGYQGKAPRAAELKLEAKSGSKVKGDVQLEDHFGGVLLTGTISGLKPNSEHGIHFHEKGDCSSKDAKSAGDHFHVAGQKHGAKDAVDSHLGDLGNVKADAKGVVELNIHAKGVYLEPNISTSVDGRSLVLHAKADDLKTQPAGDSGDRIACGVIHSIPASEKAKDDCGCDEPAAEKKGDKK